MVSFSSGLVLTLLLLMISPVLQTLSKATTSDSIWPLSGALFFLNAVLAEYGTGEASSKSQHQYVVLIDR